MQYFVFAADSIHTVMLWPEPSSKKGRNAFQRPGQRWSLWSGLYLGSLPIPAFFLNGYESSSGLPLISLQSSPVESQDGSCEISWDPVPSGLLPWDRRYRNPLPVSNGRWPFQSQKRSDWDCSEMPFSQFSLSPLPSTAGGLWPFWLHTAVDRHLLYFYRQINLMISGDGQAAWYYLRPPPKIW